MRTSSFLRWLVIGFATIGWGFPLSVLADSWGYDAAVGWLAALIGVLLVDLLCFMWSNGMLMRQVPLTPLHPSGRRDL